MKITNKQRLKWAKKVSRELNIMPKPIIYVDKKKKDNKYTCRRKLVD